MRTSMPFRFRQDLTGDFRSAARARRDGAAGIDRDDHARRRSAPAAPKSGVPGTRPACFMKTRRANLSVGKGLGDNLAQSQLRRHALAALLRLQRACAGMMLRFSEVDGR